MSGSTSGQPRVWSLWIYDRHCTLIYHADWSSFHNRTASGATAPTAAAAAAATTANASGSGSSASADGTTTTSAPGRSAVLPLAEQAKLVYGLVFSLRNMTRKLTPPASSTSKQQDTLHSFSTATYTLAHLQTPTHYTFVMLTDPVAPPTRRAPTGASAAPAFSGGGGIPATGGMTTTGVLAQITRGPWVEFVARNPGCLALERQEDDEDDDDDDDGDDDDFEDGVKADVAAAGDGTVAKDASTTTPSVATNKRQARRSERRLARQKELQRQRLTGIGKSIDSEAFRAAVEREQAQRDKDLAPDVMTRSQ